MFGRKYEIVQFGYIQVSLFNFTFWWFELDIIVSSHKFKLSNVVCDKML